MPTEASRTLGTLQLPGFHELISSAEAARAKTSQAPATEVAWAVLKAAFGTSSLDSLRTCALRGSSSKTLLRALLDGSTLSAARWQSSAMRRYRSRLRQAISELRIDGPEFSLLPTLMASHPEGLRDRKGRKLAPTLTTNPTTYSRRNGKTYPGLLPTLTVCQRDNRGGEAPGPTRPSLENLARRALLPTLKASEEHRGSPGKRDREGGPTLREALMPTLCSRDDHGPGRKHSKGGSDLPSTVGGHLNPEFCRWFMGFPEGWLDGADVPRSVRSATAASPRKRKSQAK